MKHGVQSSAGKRKVETIEIDDSDAEDELDRTSSKKVKADTTTGVESKADVLEQVPASSLAAIFPDRAQLERERLERQRKRRIEAKLPEEDDSPEGQSESKKISNENQACRSSSASKSQQKGVEELFWDGTVKKSFNQYSTHLPGTPFANFLLPTTPFQAHGLTQVIMATYCADLQWLAALFPKAPAERGPAITFICMEESGMAAGVYSPLHPDMPNWVRLVVPRKGLTEYTTMHLKFMILFYPDRLRLMILSGNLIEYDWRSIENTAFIHDFPRLPKGQIDTTSEYGKQMKLVLSSLSVPSSHPGVKMLSSYDMNSKSEARIVTSIPTMKPLLGWSNIETAGLGRLSKVVRDILKSKMKGGAMMEAQGSSMGTYSTRWLQQLHLVASGNQLEGLLPLPSGNKANKTWAQAVSRRENEKWPPIKLLFPSDRWVKTQSIEGPNGALTFFGKSKQSIERGFIDILYQPVSVRGDIMMHHKAILALEAGCDEELEQDKIVGWAYMGSHNLTQAAWGNISQSKASTEPQCTIGNWELGVVLPVRTLDLTESQKKVPSQRSASNIITWQRPADKYRKGDIPWDQFNQ